MMRTRTHLALAVCAVLTAVSAIGAGTAHAAISERDVVAQAAQPGAGGAGRAPSAAGDLDEAEDSGTGAAPIPAGASAFAPLAAAQSSGPTPSVRAGLNQPGLGWSAGLPYPSDQFGAIGPDYYVQGVTNTGIGVFRRSDLQMVAGPVPLGSFANAPAQHEVVDTQVMWDRQTSRWYYAFTYKRWVGSTRTAGLLYGWSKTSDPTDLAHGWCQMRIDTGADFDDRPKLGDTATHLIMATNADPISGAGYVRVWTMPKPAPDSTTCPASQTGVKVFGDTSDPLRSADGDRADSAIAAIDDDGSSAGYVLAADSQATTTSQLMLWHVDAAGDLIPDGNIAVSPFGDPGGVPQPGGHEPLDPVDRRLNSAVADTDPDVGATAVWTSQTIADPAGSGRSVVRWYEIVPSECAPAGGSCQAAARRQEGEVKDPSNWLFNAAMSPTDAGNEAVLHYDSASSTQLVQVRARSRISNTPLGTLGDEITLDTSDDAYDEPTCHDARPYCRWGDYAAATADPSDPHVVWGSNQAISPASGGNPNWKTRNFAVQASSAPSLAHSATGAVDAAGGDGDGVVEPGEDIDLTETVRNVGGVAATGISGSLSSDTPGVSVTSADSPYPDVGAGGTGTNGTPFAANVGSSVGCGTPLAMTVTLTTDQGRFSVPITVATGAPGTPETTTAADVPRAIPDADPDGVSSSVNVAGSGRVADANVSISRITHSWDGDLRIELIGPDGTTVVLADRPGGTENEGDNLVNTVFDDEAGTPLSGGSAPYTGSFRPQSPLSAFDGRPLQGTWTLNVADVAENDTGTLVGWGTRLAAATCDVASNVPPVASFTASPDPALTKQTISFSSTSSDPDGSVAGQAWDLDDDGQFDDGGGTSATTSFAKSGIYDVRLRVTDNRGATAIATRTVTVDNRPPVAAFASSPNPTSTGQVVSFESTSTDPDGTIASYAWDLDDDGSFDAGRTEPTASRTFAAPGTHTVTLKVTDDNGDSDIAVGTVTIDNRAPTAGFGYLPAAPATGDQITFSSESTDPDGTIATLEWDLDGDDAYDDGTGATITHTFDRSGAHVVHLRVTDSDGGSSIATRTVDVAGRPPSAAFTADPGTVTAGEPVGFDAAASADVDGSIVRYQWDLDGDGSFETDTAADPATSRLYGSPGNVVVQLRVTDDDGDTDVAERTVTVTEAPPFADGPTVPPPDAGPLPGAGPGAAGPSDPVDPGQPPADPGQTADPGRPAGRPPHGALRVASRNLRQALRRGLPLRFSSSEAATARFRVTGRAGRSRHRRRMRVGSARRLVGAGRASLRLRLSRRLRGRSRERVTVRMTLIGANGLTRTYRARVVLRNARRGGRRRHRA